LKATHFTRGQPDCGNWPKPENIAIFGTSAKYIDAVRNSGYVPRDQVRLGALRALLSTGSPLSSDGFAFVYDKIKPDLQLCSISGGTDIVSCFVLGCPVSRFLPVKFKPAALA
jgi:acetoacetyl-CoA synthetase